MRTAIWLYLFLFIAFFDLHAQYPILTPFAISLGAAPSFIGLMMGMYSLTHLPGNLMASVYVDRYGSRLFIVFSLLLAGIILVMQSAVTNPWQLLILRSISGFVIAFLSPACLALLAKLSSDISKQGKLMSGNGLVHTLASVVSPALGAILVAKIGFTVAFMILGWVLIVTSLLSFFFIKESHYMTASNNKEQTNTSHNENQQPALGEPAAIPFKIFLIPIGLSCAQGILAFELPLMVQSLDSIMTTGIFFSVVSIGSLITLSMLFVNRYNPASRTIYAAFCLSLLYFGIAAKLPVPFIFMLLMIGMGKGIALPALSHWLIQLSDGKRYGRTFSLLSIAFSIGAFFGPLLAGQLRNFVSPYFLAFAVLLIALAFNAVPPKTNTKLKANISKI